MPRRHSSKDPPHKTRGGKQTKSIRAIGIQESKKEGKTKSMGMPPAEEESSRERGKPPLAWLALCRLPREGKRDMLNSAAKRKKQKVGLLSKPPPSQIMPLSPYRLMSS